MRDRRFWTLALGVVPAVLVALATGQLLGAPGLLGTPAVVAVLALEAAMLWPRVDHTVTGDVARGRRVVLGVVVSTFTALLVAAALFTLLLVVTLGPDG